MPGSSDMIGKGIGVVVALTLVAILVANLLVPVLGNVQSTQEFQTNQSVGEIETLVGPVEANLTDANGPSLSNDATVELNDTTTASNTSKTIGAGSSATYSLEGGDINVTVNSATNTSANITYAYPNDYGVSTGTSALIGVIGVMVMIGVILLIIGWAIDIF